MNFSGKGSGVSCAVSGTLTSGAPICWDFSNNTFWKVSTLRHAFLSPAPPRLQLVPGHKGLRCTGVVEFYNGSWGGTILYKAKDRPLGLGNLICKSLQCGSFLAHLSRMEAARTPAPAELRDSRPLPIRWEAQNGSCASLQQCFQKTTTQEGGQALTVICSGKLDTDHISSGYLLP